MSETAPCPWCKDGGKPFLHRTRTPNLGYAIVCTVCHSEGPHVLINANPCDKDWEEKMTSAREEATNRWNTRPKPTS